MNTKIRLFKNPKNQIFVSGVDLHKAMKCQTPYRKWFRRMYQPFGFIEGTDYFPAEKRVYSFDGRLMPQKQHEHYLDIRMAQVLCAIHPSAEANECYLFLAKVSKDWKASMGNQVQKDDPTTKAQKLEDENQELKEKVRCLEEEIRRLHVKADFFDVLFPGKIEMPMPGVIMCHSDDGNIFADMRPKKQGSDMPSGALH